MSEGQYNILRTKSEIDALDGYLTNEEHEYIAVDTETNGLHFWKNVVIGFSLSVNNYSGFYIPFLEWTPTGDAKKRRVTKKDYMVRHDGHFTCVWTGEIYPEDVTPQQYSPPQFIKDYVAKWFKGKDLIMHNAPFDVLMIESNLGVNLEDDVFCDTTLLKHVLDETTSCSLKATAIQWQHLLNIPVSKQANKEQKEMGASVIQNGGKFTKTQKHIWRADPLLLGKYAVADTFLTYGLFEVGIKKLAEEYTDRHFKWFFQDEIMPLCREVVINMKRQGVRVNVPYFSELEEETRLKMEQLEDDIIRLLGSDLDGFTIGKSLDDEVTTKSLVEKIIKLEDLEYPTLVKKGEIKKSLSKEAVKKANNENPHWLWGYVLGEDELKYSDTRLLAIKKEIYKKRVGRRYRFSIGSDAHLRWLFCTHYKHDQTSLPQTDSATADNPIASMKAEVLKEYFLKDYDFVKPLLLWKKLRKLHSTYILPVIELNNNGYLHMDLMQNGTVSGRFACRGGFNLQTLPQVEELDNCPGCGGKNHVVSHPIKIIADITCTDCGYEEVGILCPSAIKEGFITPEGKDIVNADYSSLEPRVFAFMSGDPGLKEIYWNNLDMYSKIYCDMEDKEGVYSPDPKAANFLKKKAKHLRNMVKPVVLGIPYGARAPQTANLMGFKKTIVDNWGNEREVLDIDKGVDFRNKYLNTYPKLKAYMEAMENQALTKGYVETLVGRRRHFKTTVLVYKLLTKANKDVDWFLDLKRKDLETTNYDSIFTEETLHDTLNKAGINLVDDKGVIRTWAFVRGIFTNELNNSKNFPIQGMAAHITNRAMLDITRTLKARDIKAHVILNVHDEISGYSEKQDTLKAVDVWRQCMEHNIYTELLDVDMIAEPIVAQTLKDAK